MKADATHCNQTENTNFVLRTESARNTALAQVQRMTVIEQSTDCFTHEVLKLFRRVGNVDSMCVLINVW